MSLPVHVDDAGPLAQARGELSGVLRLARQLIRIPSQPSDPIAPTLEALSRWYTRHGLRPHLLDGDGGPIALYVDVAGTHPGPRIVLDTPADTAHFGDPAAWSYPPTSAVVHDGWLHGRGAADCKVAAATFAHLAARLADQRDQLHGTLTVLADGGEHAGTFTGIRAFLDHADREGRRPTAVAIGYPGPDHVVVGGRGFWRAAVHVHGTAGHTGGRDPHTATCGNAVVKAAALVDRLAAHAQPAGVDPALGLPPKLTVTAINGGAGHSVIPDRVTVQVDVRLTTTFDADQAAQLVQRLVGETDRTHPTDRPTLVEPMEPWPAYHTPATHPLPAALLAAGARYLPTPPTPKVAGPSNVGNLLAAQGIPVTAGFGVRYAPVAHGTDERIEVRTIPPVYAAYRDAVLALLDGRL